MQATLNLFRALPIKERKKGKVSKELLKKTLSHGFVLSSDIVSNYSEAELDRWISIISRQLGFSGSQANSSFHKSWKKIKDSSIEELVIEQLVHYFTTYGMESIGAYDESLVYIPEEILKIPKLTEKVPLVYIKGYTKEELKGKLLRLLDTGIALKEQTAKDVIEIAEFVDVSDLEVEAIKNREVKCALFDLLGKIPENPVEFLRYVVYRATKKTLLIKDKTTIETIKDNDGRDILLLFKRYEHKTGLKRLGEIFYRFKPLFLAFRVNSGLKRMVNQVRRYAVHAHKPLPEDYLNSVTAHIKHDDLNKKRLREELGKVNQFRKIRLAYALNFRANNPESIVFKIRNGKGWGTAFNFSPKAKAKEVLGIVTESIAKGISLKGKKVYLPENLVYTLPATEKQFTGNLPSGSYIDIKSDVIVGVYWENLPGYRVDLDLSLMSISGKFGWDSYYRSGDGDILFSGDMTDASGGASELFYVRRQLDSLLLNLNYFNFDETKEVPFKLFVASEKIKRMKQNYMVDPNNIITMVNSTINVQQKTLGLLDITPTGSRFYFSEVAVGKGITSTRGLLAEHSRKYMVAYHKNMLLLEDVLVEAGAKIVKDPEKCDIDLSPDKLEKDTIINLIAGK